MTKPRLNVTYLALRRMEVICCELRSNRFLPRKYRALVNEMERYVDILLRDLEEKSAANPKP